jgi:hypothetical protein
MRGAPFFRVLCGRVGGEKANTKRPPRRRPQIEGSVSQVEERYYHTIQRGIGRLDRIAGSKQSRSAFIEQVLRDFLRQRARAAVQARDLERINAAAQRLNAEASDVMEYQSKGEAE